MGRSIIAVLVGAIIFFAFQALSWMALPIHDNSMKYTPEQDSLMTVLSSVLKEDGVYSLPHYPPDATPEERQSLHESMAGKPWAMVYYHNSFEASMGKTMGIGFLLTLIAVGIVVWLTNKTRSQSFMGRFGVAFFMGVFLVIQGSLVNWNWWSVPMHWLTGEILDILIGWTLVGIWLGLFLRPGRA